MISRISRRHAAPTPPRSQSLPTSLHDGEGESARLPFSRSHPRRARPLRSAATIVLSAVLLGVYAHLLLFGPGWDRPLPLPRRVERFLEERRSAIDDDNRVARNEGQRERDAVEVLVVGKDARSLANVRATDARINQAEKDIIEETAQKKKDRREKMQKEDLERGDEGHESGVMEEDELEDATEREVSSEEKDRRENDAGNGNDGVDTNNHSLDDSHKDASVLAEEEKDSPEKLTRRQKLLRRRKKRMTPEERKERLEEAVPFLTILTFYTFLRACITLSVRWFADEGLDNLGDEHAGPMPRGGGTSRGGRGGEGQGGGSVRIGPLLLPSAGRGIFAAAARHHRRVTREVARVRYRALVSHLNATRAAQGERPISGESLRLALSDRDFDPNDYDALLRFDEENGPAVGEMIRSIGATEEEIRRCPQRIIQSEDDDLMKGTAPGSASDGRGDGEARVGPMSCAICLEQYQLGDEVRTIPCFHSFHTRCIDPWLAQKAECPVCKHPALA
mmetsp:Transcript_48286/g.145954  ORF Transcript_48286/g.145954 Transcript_48286/m.145954 type:complete len:507 (-) Transcript_48286:697-2217(-)